MSAWTHLAALLLGALLGQLARMAWNSRPSLRRLSAALRRWWWARVDLPRQARKALPDGTRVRLVCGCARCDHAGIWITSWSPRRMGGDPDAPDDYRLTREGDGESTYALRNVLEPVPPA